MASFALIIWPFLAIPFFFILGPARGLIWSVMAGYLFLPEAISLDVSGLPSYNKSSAIAFSALMGVLFTKRQARSEETVSMDRAPFRFLIFLLFVVCVVSPIGTWLTNPETLVNGSFVRPGLGPSDVVTMSSSMVIRFIPLCLAVYLLRTEALQRELLIALAVATLAYTPLVLFEWRMSPQLHTWVYGYFQHSWIQHVRGNGFRPIVFLSHGLVVGLLLMTAFLGVLALSREKTRLRGVCLMTALWFFLVLVMSRNFGATSLALLFAPVALFFTFRAQVRVAAIIAVVFLAYPAIKQAGLSPDTKVLELVETISPQRAETFGVRVDNENLLLARAAEKPVFGWGGWARTRVYNEFGRDLTIIDGLWVVIIGQTGWVGYLSFFGIVFAPFLLMRRALRRKPITPAVVGLTTVMAANTVDLIPNSTISPVGMLMLGALYAFLRYDPVEATSPVAEDIPKRSRTPRYSRFPPAAQRGT